MKVFLLWLALLVIGACLFGVAEVLHAKTKEKKGGISCLGRFVARLFRVVAKIVSAILDAFFILDLISCVT
jgi:hypothetical protein